MENKRKIALAVAAVAILGFGGLAWNSSSDQQAATNAEHGTDDGHGQLKKRKVMRSMVKRGTVKKVMAKRATVKSGVRKRAS